MILTIAQCMSSMQDHTTVVHHHLWVVVLLRHFKLSQIIRIIHGNEFLSSWIDHGNPRQCAVMMMRMQDMM